MDISAINMHLVRAIGLVEQQELVVLNDVFVEEEGEIKVPLDAVQRSIKKGSVLTVIRRPVLASSERVSTEKKYKKVVTKIRTSVDYFGRENIYVYFKGKNVRVFQISGNKKRGYRLDSSDKPPMRFDIVAVDGKSL